MKYSNIESHNGILVYPIYTKENIPELRKVEDIVNSKDKDGKFDEMFYRTVEDIMRDAVDEIFGINHDDSITIENEWDDLYIEGYDDKDLEKAEKALKLAGDTLLDFETKYLKNKGDWTKVMQ